MSKLLNWTQVLGYTIAFLTAMLVILVDCRNTLKKLAPRLNAMSFWGAWMLAFGCGLIGAICFHYSSAPWLKEQVIDLKITSPPWRGLLVGLVVLTIIRSKIANQKDQPIGGEYLYNWGRTWVIEHIWARWYIKKTNLITDTLLQKACQYADFDNVLIAQLNDRLKSRPDDQTSMSGQADNLRKTRPTSDSTTCTREWKDYYRRLISLVMDFGGESILPVLVDVGAPASLAAGAVRTPTLQP